MATLVVELVLPACWLRSVRKNSRHMLQSNEISMQVESTAFPNILQEGWLTGVDVILKQLLNTYL